MADANYVLLEKITVGAAGASSVTFNNIPQTGYTDLVVKVCARMTTAAAGEYLNLSFNGVTTNLNAKNLYGYSTAAASYNEASIINIGQMPGSTATASTFGLADIYIPNYTSSNYKSVSLDVVAENNSAAAASATQYIEAGLWSSTAAITSITMTAQANLIATNSTFYLYGVAKLGTTPAIQPYATGGDTIMTDGTYWYHAFKSSGTFTPAKGLSCDVLVVAGGGGSGGSNLNDKGSGGGGAGGLLAFTSQSLTNTGYTVTVGAGGAGGSSTGLQGSNGSNSQFASLTASVGGGGGGGGYAGSGTGNPWIGLSGGSGGGGVKNNIGGTAISGQGNNGGAETGNSDSGAGGGGAGAVGTSISANPGGAGGAGVNTYSTWLNTTGTGVSGFIAGGGGGGAYSGSASTGGAGGGGAGGSAATQGSAGVANTGGGGGGTGGNTAAHAGNAGGSGIVIVRYAI